MQIESAVSKVLVAYILIGSIEPRTSRMSPFKGTSVAEGFSKQNHSPPKQKDSALKQKDSNSNLFVSNLREKDSTPNVFVSASREKHSTLNVKDSALREKHSTPSL